MATQTLNEAGDREARRRAARTPALTAFRSWRADPLVLFCALGLNMLGLALPLAALQIYDAVIAHQAIETLSALVIGLVLVALLETALRVAQSHVMALAGQRATHRSFAEAVDRELAGSALLSEGLSPTRRLERFRALDALGDFLSGDQRRQLIDLPFASVYLGALTVIGGWLVLAPLGVAALAMLSAAALLRHSRAAARKSEEGAERRAEFLSEVFGAILTVKALGAEAAMARRHERLAAAAGAHHHDTSAASSDIQAAILAFTAFGALATVIIGAVLVIHDLLTVGAMVACSMLSSRALQPLLRAVSAAAERARAAIAAESAAALFADAPRPPTIRPSHRDGPATLVARNATLWRESRLVLDEAEFSPRPGAATVFEADDPEAVSKLFRALIGLEPLDGGSIEIDGAPATQRQSGVGEIALVTQETQLFRGEILENLTLFGNGANTRDALEAARAVGLERFLNTLPNGYQHPVDGGAADALPPARRRQLVLARALAQRPRLLILDRIGEQLDADATRAVAAALASARGETTILLQERDPALRAIAETRIALKDGWTFIQPAAPLGAPAEHRP